MSRFRVYLNMGTIADLPEGSMLPKLEGADLYTYLQAAGFEGLQGGDPVLCRELGLGCAGGGRVDRPEDAWSIAHRDQAAGFEHTTLHVGTGLETDAEMDELVQAVVAASRETGYPLSIETHRATITQDLRRLVDMVARNPDVRINGDFSHLYTGQEMVYGDFEGKLDLLEGVFERVRFMHGRIGSPGCIQVDIGEGVSPCLQQTGPRDFLSDFREIWTRAMAGFLRHADDSETLIFAPEILMPSIYYVRCFQTPDGRLDEECDRYQQALVYARIARECFASAEARLSFA